MTLWEAVTRTVRPLARRHTAIQRNASKSQQSAAGPKPKSGPRSGGHAPDFHLKLVPAHQHHAPPPLASLDRRFSQKLTRGQMEPDNRIDLHGMSLELARLRLLHFIEKCRQEGDRLVLVITGKGNSPFGRHTLHGASHFQAPEREGLLRRELPFWLQESQFRHHVHGFQPAHPRHGGGGAFYLGLRKSLAHHRDMGP